MKKLKSKRIFPKGVDIGILPLVQALNCIPGIETIESCTGHGKQPPMVFFHVHSDMGLFFLVRCIDKRYGGWPWKIELSVGDIYTV
jgi:hypothetical protein